MATSYRQISAQPPSSVRGRSILETGGFSLGQRQAAKLIANLRWPARQLDRSPAMAEVEAALNRYLRAEKRTAKAHRAETKEDRKRTKEKQLRRLRSIVTSLSQVAEDLENLDRTRMKRLCQYLGELAQAPDANADPGPTEFGITQLATFCGICRPLIAAAKRAIDRTESKREQRPRDAPLSRLVRDLTDIWDAYNTAPTSSWVALVRFTDSAVSLVARVPDHRLERIIRRIRSRQHRTDDSDESDRAEDLV
jgi:hypothetical protein